MIGIVTTAIIICIGPVKCDKVIAEVNKRAPLVSVRGSISTNAAPNTRKAFLGWMASVAIDNKDSFSVAVIATPDPTSDAGFLLTHVDLRERA